MSSLVAVAIARLSRCHCLRRCARSPRTGAAVSPYSRRRGARPPSSAAVALALGAVRCCRRRALSARCCRRFSLGAVAVARLSRRRCLPRRVRGPHAGVVMPPHSRQPHAWPPLLRGGVFCPWRDASLLAARALCTCRRRCRVLSRQVAFNRLSRHCAAACGAALAALAPASWCRRTRGGMALGHRSSAAASLAIGVMQRGRRRVHSARAIGAVRSSLGRSLSRGSHSAAACGAAPAVLAPAPSCRRTRGDVAHGRRCSAAAALLLGAVRRSRRRALSARCCRRSSLGSVVVARLSGAASCGAALRVIRDSPSNAVACQRLVRRRTRSPVA